MNASRRRSASLASLVVSIAACGALICGGSACGTDAKPSADPPVASSSGASASAAAAPSALPSGAVVLDTTKTAGPGATAAPIAEGAAVAAGRPKSMPAAPNGIVDKKVADGILKTGQPPKLTVLAPGGEPHEQLAYAFDVGKTVQLNMGMKMRMKMSAGSRQLPAPEIPKLNMLLDLSVKSKSPKGDFELDAGIKGATVHPSGALEEQVAAKMQPQLDSMSGLRIHYFVSPSGTVRDVTVTAVSGDAGAQQAIGQMTQSFESMVAPLPDEPVGVGAKWEVVSRVASSGADLLQWASYELTAREGSALSMNLTVRQLAADSAIASPGMPPGVTASLRSFQSEGRGESKLDLGSPAPLGGKVAVLSTMEIAVTGGGAGQQPGAIEAMKVESQVTVDFSRPTPGAP